MYPPVCVRSEGHMVSAALSLRNADWKKKTCPYIVWAMSIDYWQLYFFCVQLLTKILCQWFMTQSTSSWVTHWPSPVVITFKFSSASIVSDLDTVNQQAMPRPPKPLTCWYCGCYWPDVWGSVFHMSNITLLPPWQALFAFLRLKHKAAYFKDHRCFCVDLLQFYWPLFI